MKNRLKETEGNIIKEIYLVHQYLEKSHFKALYDCAEEHGYNIKGFIVLEKKNILCRFRDSVIKDRKFIDGIKNLFCEFYNLVKIRFLKNKVLIVGIAPYDYLLNKYHKCFQKNNSIYFTSWQTWDGSDFPRGNIQNREVYEQLMVSSFKGSACVSELTYHSIKKIIKNSRVVNHAINVDEYEKKYINSIEKKKKFIYLGQFIDRKNINLILDWITNNTNKEFEFAFAGYGNLDNKIINLSKVDNRVSFLGKLTKANIKEKLKEYDFMVLPSKDEPFGIVLIEALASGVPCIVSNASGPIEIIKNNQNGYIFDLEKENDFYYVMNKALTIQSKEQIKLIKGAIESSKKYDSKELIKAWISIIENK